MYWTLELASYLSDAPWPANKDELIDYSIRTGAPLEVVENLQARGQTSNVFFVSGRDRNTFNRVLGFSEDGTTCLFNILINLNRAVVTDFDVRMIDGNPIIFVTGRWNRRGRNVFSLHAT